MNKLYPALIVLILCSMSTVPLLISYQRDKGLPMAGLEFVLLYPIWIVAGTMLAAIALAPRDGVGATLIVTTVLMIACAACVIFLAKSSEKRSQERRLKRAEERTK
jgi:fucose 4-O-acetylase-like acetyltransferase